MTAPAARPVEPPRLLLQHPPARHEGHDRRPVTHRRAPPPAARAAAGSYPPSMLRVALVLVVLVAVGLIGSQFLLPRIAARRLADDLRRSGDIDRVRVRAMPALKLLFGRADSVEIRMTEARAGTGRLADLLDEARGTDRLDARAARARVGPLLARDLRLSKRGDAVRAQAAVSDADLAAALPPGTGLRPVEAGDGELVLEASAGVLGFRAAVRARLSARDGALVIAPDGLLGALGSLTLFADPRGPAAGGGARRASGGFVLAAHARLASVG